MRSVEKAAFAGLAFAQAAHSTEEYYGRLWETFPPAQFLTNLVSSNLEVGFLIINAAIVIFAFACLVFIVAPARAGARALIWFWAVIEMLNGAGHLIWAGIERGYRPGAATAPFLLLFAACLLYLRLTDAQTATQARR